MFLFKQGSRQRGFTLIELAIVLGVVGVMTGGLWKLMSTGNQQTKDQAAAQQQLTLINAVQGFMNDPQGQALLNVMTASGTVTLPLPLGACTGVETVLLTAPQGNAAPLGPFNIDKFCSSYLPSGFISTTPNSYGQTYSIQVMKDSNPQNFDARTYSFIIVASGTVIPDPDGGRISGLIGGDGGFIYATNVCGGTATKAACGTMGSWSIGNINAAGAGNYNSAAFGNGSIVSRTFVSPMTSSNNWLSRSLIPGEPVAPSATNTYNTMLTNLAMKGFDLYLGSVAGLTGGGNAHLQGGTLSVEGPATSVNRGTIDLGSNGVITSTVGGTTSVQINGDSSANVAYKSGVTIFDTNAGACNGLATCPNILAVTGNVGVTGELNALDLYASNIMYTASDMRLKKDVTPLPHALDNIMKINPVSFVYKATGKKALGVIAQELDQIYPQLVAKDHEGYLSVAYQGLIAPLIGSVQELKKENDELRSLIKAQEERQQKMQQELDALKPQ